MILTLARSLRARVQIARNPITYARNRGVTVGQDCRFLGTDQGTFGSEPYLITIGNHVTITGSVRFVTHDGGVWVFRGTYPNIDVIDKITVGDNVFIGLGAIILPGVTIGSHCVIGAGSVVAASVPPNTVVAGVPARHIRTIGEYEARIMPKALHVRNLPAAEKRAAFLLHVGSPTQD